MQLYRRSLHRHCTCQGSGSLPDADFHQSRAFFASSQSLTCTLLLCCRLLEDKQSLLDENIQLRKDLLQLQQDHIALLQLVSVQQQQLQQHEAASAKQSAQNRCLQSQPSLQSLRSYQQQVVLRPSSSVRDSLSRESTASPMQFAHKGSSDLSRKQKKPK